MRTFSSTQRLRVDICLMQVNCVLMRNINDAEINDFVEMTRDKDIEIRFIEYVIPTVALTSAVLYVEFMRCSRLCGAICRIRDTVCTSVHIQDVIARTQIHALRR